MIEFNKKNVSVFTHNFISKLFHFSFYKFGILWEDYPKVRIYLDDKNSSFTLVNGVSRIKISYNNHTYYNEYSFIENDNEIGGFYPTNWQQGLAALLCHEFAHLIIACAPTRINTVGVCYEAVGINKSEKNQADFHKEDWQTVYRILRNKFVNYEKWN